MRTIKFRGKRIDNGEWVYGYLVVENLEHEHCVAITSLNTNFHYRSGWEDWENMTKNYVIPETVGQLASTPFVFGERAEEYCGALP